MIEFQISDRKTGKTTLLLEWIKAAPEGERRLFVAGTVEMAQQAWKRSEEMGMKLAKHDFVSVNQIVNGNMRGLKNAILGIDNIDIMLQGLFDHYPVGRVTATGVDILHAD